MAEVKPGVETSEFKNLQSNNKMAWVGLGVGLLVFLLGGVLEIFQADPGMSPKLLMILGILLKVASQAQKLLANNNWANNRTRLKLNGSAKVLMFCLILSPMVGCKAWQAKTPAQRLTTVVQTHAAANRVVNEAANNGEMSLKTFRAYVKVSDELYETEKAAYAKIQAGETLDSVFWQEQIFDKLNKLVAWQLEAYLNKKKKEGSHGNGRSDGSRLSIGSRWHGHSGIECSQGTRRRITNGQLNEGYAGAWCISGRFARNAQATRSSRSSEDRRCRTVTRLAA